VSTSPPITTVETTPPPTPPENEQVVHYEKKIARLEESVAELLSQLRNASDALLGASQSIPYAPSRSSVLSRHAAIHEFLSKFEGR
jgi:hypothetical protein